MPVIGIFAVFEGGNDIYLNPSEAAIAKPHKY